MGDAFILVYVACLVNLAGKEMIFTSLNQRGRGRMASYAMSRPSYGISRGTIELIYFFDNLRAFCVGEFCCRNDVVLASVRTLNVFSGMSLMESGPSMRSPRDHRSGWDAGGV